MTYLDLISIGLIFVLLVIIAIVVYRLSKLASEEKKNSELKKAIYRKKIQQAR